MNADKTPFYSATYVVFDINPADYSKDNIEQFVKNVGAKDLVVLNPSTTDSGWYRCYSTRMNNGKFRLKNGEKSLAKKMKMTPNSLNIIPCGRSKMPDHFFNFLEVSKPMDEQVAFSMGKYAATQSIKKYIDAALKQNKNRQIVNAIKKEGSLATVDNGYISVGQLKGAKNYEAELKEVKEDNERSYKELANGSYLPFDSFKTGKQYLIKSESELLYPDKDTKEIKSSQSTSKVIKEIEVEGKLLRYIQKKEDQFVKRKHYYFYSKQPGYGKSTFIQALLAETNASQIVDANNWMNVSKDAQFLVIDEYGPTNKIPMDKLKGLTAGNASTFGGNRKSYGKSFQPRKDAQLIIFSNYHLFDVMGRKTLDSEKETRKVTEQEADILSDRFFIHRLDDGKSDDNMDIENEECDRLKHTEGMDNAAAAKGTWIGRN